MNETRNIRGKQARALVSADTVLATARETLRVSDARRDILWLAVRDMANVADRALALETIYRVFDVLNIAAELD